MKPIHLSALLLALLCVPGPREDGGPAEGEHALDWQLGTWRGVRRDAADGSEAPMVMRVRSVLGGAGQTRELEVSTPGSTYRGLCVQVFDPEADLWRRCYVNDVRRGFAWLEGDGTTWRSVSPDRTRESRLASRRPEPDRWVRTMSVSDDDGATWRALWTDELTRE